MEEAATERSSLFRPTKAKRKFLCSSVQSQKVLSTKISGLLMFSEIGKLRARKKKFLYLCLDILTRVFGYLIARVWICSLPGIKGNPCDPNEATQLVYYPCIIN